MARASETPFQKRMETFRRILQLERERGFEDRAVVGGLDRFLDQWREEPAAGADEGTAAALRNTEVFAGGYGDLTSEQREAWAGRVLTALRGLAAPADDVRPLPAPDSPPSRYRERATRSNPGSLSLESAPTVVRGIGPGIAQKLKTLGIETVRDLLYHHPRRHVPLARIADLVPGEEAAIVGTVWQAQVVRMGGKGMEATEAVLGDDTGNLRAVWFNQPFVARSVHANDTLLVTGNLRWHQGQRSFEPTSYEVVDADDDNLRLGRMLPVYPSTEGLTQRVLRRVVRNGLEAWLPRLADFLPPELARRLDLPHLADALWGHHYPENGEGRDAARRRLAFDELFLLQLTLLIRKREWGEEGDAVPLKASRKLLEAFLSSLPFTLTDAQRQSLREVLGDIAGRRPMARLLQGEVGSGKTVVALAAMLVCAAVQRQAAMMAPTEVLAEQHFLTVSRLLQGLSLPMAEPNLLAVYLDPHPRPITVGLLLGSHTRKEKAAMRERITQGLVDIVVGTHALIQGDVEMPNLALSVVDEQQRFGVVQRRALGEKGTRAHVLSMSATPIPRSLALTLYGDLDVSTISELPSGRQRVQTKWLRPDRRDSAYRWIRREVEMERQCFVICPLINESETLQARAALEEHRRLTEEVFPDLRVGLLHGRMSLAEKRSIMEELRDGDIQILVATPVVEVGVDIPNATVMMIEGADRFGLSELHQFRGRVGRGEHASYCILMADDPSPEAQERLSVLENESDGFRVAEEDLRLRGPGELFGTRQSGLPELKLATLFDWELLRTARQEAARLVEADPRLEQLEHRPVAEALTPYLATVQPDFQPS